MNIYLQNSLLLDKNRFVVVIKSLLDLHCTASSLQFMAELKEIWPTSESGRVAESIIL